MQMQKADAERERLQNILIDAGVSQRRQKTLAPVIENVAWMKAKLDEARGGIQEESVAVPYDNGGGQTGIRENPMFKGYEALWRSYLQGMDRILNALPEEQIEAAIPKEDRPQTVLEMVQAKHKKTNERITGAKN